MWYLVSSRIYSFYSGRVDLYLQFGRIFDELGLFLFVAQGGGVVELLLLVVLGLELLMLFLQHVQLLQKRVQLGLPRFDKLLQLQRLRGQLGQGLGFDDVDFFVLLG